MAKASFIDDEDVGAGSEALTSWFSADWKGRQRSSNAEPEALESLHSALVVLWRRASSESTRAFSDGFELALSQAIREAHRTPAGNSTNADEDFAESFAAALAEDSAVEGVFWDTAIGVLHVWTVLEAHDHDAEERVYAAEQHTIDSFPHQPVRFRVLYSHGAPLADVPPAGARRVG